MNRFAKGIFSIVCLTINGCGGVRSYNLGKEEVLNATAGQNDNQGYGIQYFLPKQRLEFKLVRKIGKKKEVKEAYEKAKAARDEATARHAANIAEIKKLEGEIAVLSKPSGNRGLLAKKEEKKAQAELDSIALEMGREAARDEFEKRELDFNKAENDIPNYEISIAALELEPDPNYAFRLVPQHNWLRDDEMTFQVNDKGLLTGAKTISEDKTGEIFTSVAKTAAYFLTPRDALKIPVEKRTTFSLTPTSDADTRFKKLGCKPGEDNKEPVVIHQVFQPDSELEVATLNEQLICQGTPFQMEVVEPEAKALITEGDDIKSSDSVVTSSMPGIFYRTRFPYVLHLKRTNVTGPEPKLTIKEIEIDNSDKSVKRLSPSDPEVYVVTEQSNLIMLPNKSPISFIPLKNGPLVKTEHDLVFADGILTKWDSDRPSELAALFRIPVGMLDALLESFGKIIPFANKSIDNQAKLLELELKRQDTLSKIENLVEEDSDNAKLLEQTKADTAQIKAEIEKLEAERVLEQRKAGEYETGTP